MTSLYNAMGIISSQKAASVNSNSAKTSAIENYNRFAAYIQFPEWPNSSAENFCDEEHIRKFAYFLVNIKVKADGSALAKNTVLGYLSRMMNLAKERWGKQYKTFFDVIGDNKGSGGRHSASKTWYTDLNNDIETITRRYAIEHAQRIENEAPPLARCTLSAISVALFGLATKDSTYRRFVLILMWYAVGRTAESAMACWNLIRWDFKLNMLFF